MLLYDYVNSPQRNGLAWWTNSKVVRSSPNGGVISLFQKILKILASRLVFIFSVNIDSL